MPQFKVRYHVPFLGFYPGGDFLGLGSDDVVEAARDDFAKRVLRRFKAELTDTALADLDEANMTITSNAIPPDDGTITPPHRNGWTGVGVRYYRIHVNPLFNDPNGPDATQLLERQANPAASERAYKNRGEIHLERMPGPLTGGRKSRRNRRTGRRKARKSRTTRRH